MAEELDRLEWLWRVGVDVLEQLEESPIKLAVGDSLALIESLFVFVLGSHNDPSLRLLLLEHLVIKILNLLLNGSLLIDHLRPRLEGSVLP